MKLRHLLFLLILGFSPSAYAQFAPLTTFSYDSGGISALGNAGSAILSGQLLKQDSAGRMIPVTTSDIRGVVAVALSGAGQSGASLRIASLGLFDVLVDGSCSVGQSVTISNSLAGAATCSSLARQQIGVAGSNSAASGQKILLHMTPLSSSSANTSAFDSAYLRLDGANSPVTGIVTFSNTVKSNGFISTSSLPAATGTLRLSHSDVISWRNHANNGDVNLVMTDAGTGHLPENTLLFQNGAAIAGVVAGFFGEDVDAVSASGIIRLQSNSTGACWRNNANSADLCIVKNGADLFSVPGIWQAGQVKSTIATGTAPLIIASTTPVVNLTAVPTTYNHSGTQQTGVHIVQDSCTLGTDCAVTLTGAAVFTNATSYTCNAQDQTAIAATKIVQTSGSALTITGTGTDAIRYSCQGN